MHPRDRLTQAAVAIGRALNALAYSMVEDEYAVGASRGLDQPLGFGIVDLLDLGFVVEVLHRAFLANEGKSLTVERYSLADRTEVMNRQAVQLRHNVRLRFAERRLKGVGSRPAQRGCQIVE